MTFRYQSNYSALLATATVKPQW